MSDISVAFPQGEINPTYVVIAAQWKDKWVFVRKLTRETWETPGGHIEAGEDTETAAKRELYEETGATEGHLWEICPYRVERDAEASDGVLYYARIDKLEDIPVEEEGERCFLDQLADAISIPLTYPQIQPILFARVQAWLALRTTKVYFIRHCDTDYSVRDGRIRPLTEQGLRDAALLPLKLEEIPLDAIYSSPYKRAVDTVTPLAEARGLPVIQAEGFHEQLSGNRTVNKHIPFDEVITACWTDRDYHAEGGESLAMVRERNIAALSEVLRAQQGKTVAIGTHGMALSVIISHYFGTGQEFFEEIREIMPYVVRLDFLEEELVGGMRVVEV